MWSQNQTPNPVINPALTPLVNPGWAIVTGLLNQNQYLTDPVIWIINSITAQNSTDADRVCAIKHGLLDYQMPTFTFDINKGAVQHIYIRRDYYQWYDPFNCGPFNRPGPCGSDWHFKNQSNIATITLTTADFPKPVPSIAGPDQASCNWTEQYVHFNVKPLNNGEYYKWEIPSTWIASTPLEGPYLNDIVVNTNSAVKNAANGGQVCLTVTQGSQVDRQCKTVKGSTGFYVHTASISACDGQTVIIKPNIGDHTASTYADPANYTFSWTAYQSPIQSCNNPAGSSLTDCKELKITVTNVKQNPTQSVGLTLTDKLGCVYTTNYVITAAPGVQMGILNNPNDPLAVSTSSLAVDASSNFLYFTGANRVMWRAYFDNTPGQQIWKYAQIVDKNNINIRGDGPVAIYKGSTSKLFYTYNNGTLTYAESSDNGQTWIDYRSITTVASGVDSRIKVWGGNIYYITTDRKVYYKNISNLTGNGIPVGNATMNYSTHMFTVEDGILAYADASNNIVAFDALSGAAFTINVPANIKQMNFNSSISTYKGNIYYTANGGILTILKKNVSTGIYDNYEQVPNLNLAGPFAINKQTGTVYAKAYDVPGKMIYYLNNKWNTTTIETIVSSSPIASNTDMTYANGHAFYIGDYGSVSNTYYVAPCTPAVLRTALTTDENGDVLNQDLSNEITEDRTVLLYPNPASSQLKVTFTIPQESNVRINIIPVTGGSSDVLYNNTTEGGTQDVSVDLSSYAGGLYLIQLYVNGSLYGTSKLVKQ